MSTGAPDEAALRAAVCEAARALTREGLNRSTAGNVSARCAVEGAPGMLITPTGVAAEDCAPAHLAAMKLDGSWQGTFAPSSEWRFHRDIYAARPEAGAIVHAHSPFATALACQGKPIPAFHYMIARFGGADVRCADYATFGTQALSDAALAALDGRCACLLGNHGMLAFGRDPAHALALAVEFETLCEQYWRTCQLGAPVILPTEEMARVLDKFRSYGQPAPAGQNT